MGRTKSKAKITDIFVYTARLYRAYLRRAFLAPTLGSRRYVDRAHPKASLEVLGVPRQRYVHYLGRGLPATWI